MVTAEEAEEAAASVLLEAVAEQALLVRAGMGRWGSTVFSVQMAALLLLWERQPNKQLWAEALAVLLG